MESRIWIVGAACGENETSCQHPAARRLTEPFDSALRARGGKDLPQRCWLSGREWNASLIVSHDRLASPCRGSGSRSRPQAAKRWRVSAPALTDCCWSGLFAPSGLARHRSKVERMALASLISLRSRAKPMAGRFLRRLPNLNSHNHNQRDRRRRFYLAVLIERLTFAPRYDISLRRYHARHVSPYGIDARADRSRIRWLMAAEPSCAR